MKILFLSILFSCRLLGEPISLNIPLLFDRDTLPQYKLVWGNPQVADFNRVGLIGKRDIIDLDFSKYRPNEVMLYRNGQYVISLKIIRSVIKIPNIVSINYDITGLGKGGIYVDAEKREGKFYKMLYLPKKGVFYAAVGEHFENPLALRYFGGKQKEPQKVALFSVDHNADHELTVGLSKEGLLVVRKAFHLNAKTP